MEDLAREVGIGKGTIYLHFPSKREVTLSHITRIVDRLLDRLQGIAASSKPLDDRVREMLVTRVLFRFDSVQHYSKSLNDLLSDLRPELLARRQKYFEKESKVFARVLQRGKSAGIFTCNDPRAAARALITATNALLPYSLSVQELGSRKQTETRAAEIAELLINGLTAGGLKIHRRSK